MSRRRGSSYEAGKEAVPDGVIPASSHHQGAIYPPANRSRVGGRLICAHPTSERAFQVTPAHAALPGGGGVVFAVEDTVPEPADRAMPVLSREEELSRVKAEAGKFHSCGRGHADIVVEQASQTPPGLVFAGGHGFLAAALTAFARHLPLTLGPDQVWALISFGFAQHVDKNAEELRHQFVQHEGKKRLMISVSPSFRGSPPEQWERVVFPGFSAQIRAHIGKDTHSAIAGSFSTTSATAQAAHEITLMTAMKHYFSYGMTTCCGISKVTLLGTEGDWVGLRTRAEALSSRMTPAFRKQWLPKLLPVLDQFVAAYRGDVHHGFWQSMVKMRHKSSNGSGDSSADYVTGWIQILFPYLRNGVPNHAMQPWEHCYFRGPKTEDFPSTLSSVPVDWDGLSLHFHAGVTGFTQNPDDGTLSPVLGWRVTHDPTQPPALRIKVATAEVDALRKGMAGNASDAAAEARVTALEAEIARRRDR